jgi:hypothetical protein
MIDKAWITIYENSYLLARVCHTPPEELSYAEVEARAQSPQIMSAYPMPDVYKRAMAREPSQAYACARDAAGLLAVLGNALEALRPAELNVSFPHQASYPLGLWGVDPVPPWCTVAPVAPGIWGVEIVEPLLGEAGKLAWDVRRDQEGRVVGVTLPAAFSQLLRGGFSRAGGTVKRYQFTTAEEVLAFVRDRLPPLPASGKITT